MIIDAILTSVAATTACTSLGSTVNAADTTARRGATQELGHSREGWALAMESRQQPTTHAVDFWTDLSAISRTRNISHGKLLAVRYPTKLSTSPIAKRWKR